MTPDEMASDQRQRENHQIKEKALFDCERGGPPKATTDQFKCGRCGQRKTTYYQLQTRSADEPMTTFVTCGTVLVYSFVAGRLVGSIIQLWLRS
ncbi:hypothetical protein NL676_018815 [Syzygium grande]|nr:hypothetical protein NL676_018815 [Syzygium grande]